MRACNPRGPLVVAVAKLFPKSDVSAFDALGRILSGTVKPGDRVRVLGEAYTPEVRARWIPYGNPETLILPGTVKPGDRVRVLGGLHARGARTVNAPRGGEGAGSKGPNPGE